LATVCGNALNVRGNIC